MRDSFYDVLEGFYNTLAGNVTYEGNEIPVYTGLPKATGTASDYIYIGEITQVDFGGADEFSTEETITIQIVCRQRGDDVSKKKLAIISSQVYDLLKATYTSEIALDGFTMYGLHLDNAFTDFEVTDQDYALRKIARFRYFLYENAIAEVSWDSDLITFDSIIYTFDIA